MQGEAGGRDVSEEWRSWGQFVFKLDSDYLQIILRVIAVSVSCFVATGFLSPADL